MLSNLIELLVGAIFTKVILLFIWGLVIAYELEMVDAVIIGVFIVEVFWSILKESAFVN